MNDIEYFISLNLPSRSACIAFVIGYIIVSENWADNTCCKELICENKQFYNSIITSKNLLKLKGEEMAEPQQYFKLLQVLGLLVLESMKFYCNLLANFLLLYNLSPRDPIPLRLSLFNPIKKTKEVLISEVTEEYGTKI